MLLLAHLMQIKFARICLQLLLASFISVQIASTAPILSKLTSLVVLSPPRENRLKKTKKGKQNLVKSQIDHNFICMQLHIKFGPIKHWILATSWLAEAIAKLRFNPR